MAKKHQLILAALAAAAGAGALLGRRAPRGPSAAAGGVRRALRAANPGRLAALRRHRAGARALSSLGDPKTVEPRPQFPEQAAHRLAEPSGRACVGLRGFPARAADLDAAPLPAHVATKDEYFRHLASRGILPGGRWTRSGGCASGARTGAELLSAERLSAAGYGFVAFVGDSLAREAAHAAIRLVEGDIAQCQPWATGRGLHITNTPQRPSEHRFPGDCCAGGPTTVFHAIDDMLDGLDSFVAQLDAACPCKGILYLETGLHVVFDGEVARKYGAAEGREAYTHDTLARLAARNPRDHALVWASPGAIDLVTMGLPPAKPDMDQFVNTNAPAVLAAWREMDERAVARLNAAGTRAAYAPQHEVSSAYRGLSNDGIHFGEKGLGFSFPVVTDVLTQLWLHPVLRLDEAPLGIC